MLNDLRFRVRALFRHQEVEEELDEELRFHFDREVQKYIGRGISAEEARRMARTSFGSHEQVKENCREARGTGFIELTLDDARYAVRQLVANPTFSIVMILTLALSIGANSAIFSVINGVMLKKLPYEQPEQLVRLFLSNSSYPKFPLNPWDFLDFRARNHSFDGIAAFTRGDVQISGDGEPVKLNGFGITSGYFRVLGLRPELGREFDFQAEIPGNGLQVILSDRIWRTRFGADPTIVGRKITLNMQPFTVIGVMPSGTQHPGNVYHSVAYGESVDVWWPFSFAGNSNQRGSHFIEGIGRLKPGVSAERARSEMNAIMTQLGREHPDSGDTGWQVLVIPLYAEVVGASRQMLLVLLGAVGIVLLIACANAANLLMVRASARQREIAVRLAMGAPRLRVVRQLLTESLVISCAGGVLGLLLAFAGVRGLVMLLPADFPRANDIHVSWPVLVFTLAVSLITGILFGLAPALQASHTDPKDGLQKTARGATAGRHQNRLRSALVMAEVGLASVLLIGAGLMLRTFLNLIHLDPGFNEDHLLTATLSLPHAQYKTGEQTAEFYNRLMTSLNSLPGVESAGAGSDLPWTGYDENTGFAIEGKKPAVGDDFHARYHMATPGYFSAMGIPLLAGRSFTDADKRGAPAAVIINHAMAAKYWPQQDAVGKRISFEDDPKKDSDWLRIVGVVGDVKDRPNSPGAEPSFWWPENQASQPDLSIAIRTRSDPRQAIDGLRQAVRQLDPALAVADVKLMNEVADSSLATPRFTFALVGLFAGLAIVLAAIGSYGVISYSVGQRASEFGLRVALGAQRGDLLRMVLAQCAKLAVPGTILGVVLALSLSRVVRGLIYQVSPTDPVIMSAVVVLVLGVALLASYVPARRAAGADPMTTLRTE